MIKKVSVSDCSSTKESMQIVASEVIDVVAELILDTSAAFIGGNCIVHAVVRHEKSGFVMPIEAELTRISFQFFFCVEYAAAIFWPGEAQRGVVVNLGET